MEVPEYIVFDIETSIKNRGDEAVGDFQASPYNPANQIVMLGAKHSECPEVSVWKGEKLITHMPHPSEDTVIVGHNLGFDLAYMYRDYAEWYEWSAKGLIWDTMLVAYIISGQEEKFISLNKCSEQAGGTLKDERISEYWKAGVDTEDIPEEELEEYMVHDVKNTELVFLRQVQQVREMGIFPLVRSMMEARMATMEMELNGMYMDREIADREKARLQLQIDTIETDIELEMCKSFPTETHDILNFNSTTVIGAYLFGGTVKYKMHESVMDDLGLPVLIKSGPNKGQTKMKWNEYEHTVSGMFNGDTYSEKGISGKWATGESVLNKILKDYKSFSLTKTDPLECVKNMLKVRGLNKDMSAYYVGYVKLLWHDDLLHPQFHHCATDTGRLSCSKPNVQQTSGKED